MGTRGAWGIVAAVVLAVVGLGLFFDQPSAAEPRASTPATPRYQVVAAVKSDEVVVLDTLTGHCWKKRLNDRADDWEDLGAPPARGK